MAYKAKLLELQKAGKIPATGLNTVAVYHDSWCAIYSAPANVTVSPIFVSMA